MYQVAMVAGPALGGVLIAQLGIGAAYTTDAVSCLGMVAAASAMSPQRPAGESHEPFLRSIRSGLGFVRRSQALVGSFAIDLAAMTFGIVARRVGRGYNRIGCPRLANGARIRFEQR